MATREEESVFFRNLSSERLPMFQQRTLHLCDAGSPKWTKWVLRKDDMKLRSKNAVEWVDSGGAEGERMGMDLIKTHCMSV